MISIDYSWNGENWYDFPYLYSCWQTIETETNVGKIKENKMVSKLRKKTIGPVRSILYKQTRTYVQKTFTIIFIFQIFF